MRAATRKQLIHALLLASLTVAIDARASESVAAFGHIGEEKAGAAADEEPGDPRWAAVATDKISLVNFAPVLLPYFNNGPVFGLPGTVTGSFWRRTQLNGDWGGGRTDLARRGLFFDLYTTSAYQDVTSGGLAEGNSFVQSAQLSFNLDTGRAGLWDGGLLHVTAHARYGDSAHETFTSGASVPQYTALLFPAPELSDDAHVTEYYLTQALSRHFSVVLGKINNIFIPDQTLFADSYKYYFANFNFNKNAMTPNFYHPTALAALGLWAPSPRFAVAGGVLDPYSQADNFASDAFKDVNLYLTTVSTYSVGGRPGQFSPAFNWSNQPQLDLESPFGQLSPSQIPGAVATLLGAHQEGLPVNHKDESWIAVANLSQYLWVKEDAAEIPEKMRSGQVLHGIGLFGRVGYAPEDTNTVARDASIGLFAHGLFGRRPYDSFGAAFYYNAISDDLKDSIARLTAGSFSVEDEKGVEVFYNLAITPAIRLNTSYQHIWNPLIAQVATQQDAADVFIVRLNIAF